MSKPMGPRGHNMARPPKKARKGTFKRLVGYVTEYYKLPFILVLICIGISSLATALPGIFQQKVLDAAETGLGYIGDGASTETALEMVLHEITNAVLVLICIYAIGLVASFIKTRTMAVITQGFLHRMRVLMFDKMQTLPIKYFDTHKHGDIMSHYTNDIDTLRQLISQSLPQIITSCVILITVLFIMLYFSLWMTLVVLFGVMLMLITTKKIGGGGAKYFIKQQQALGKRSERAHV